MFRFEQPIWLWGLLLTIMVFAFFVFNRKKLLSQLSILFAKKYWSKYLPNFNHRKQWIAHTFLFLSIAFVWLALANPQKRGTPRWSLKEGKEIVLAFDLSSSMLAEDVAPNRLTHSKEFVKRFIGALPQDQFGLITFAGNAYIQVPMTSDPSAILMHLQAANPSKMPIQGTRIAEALSKVGEVFTSEKLKNKVVLLISDGEDHESEAVQRAEEMARQGVKIIAIGVGSEDGAKIIDEQTGRYKVDQEGVEVISRKNPEMLAKLASFSGGGYYDLNNLSQVVNQVRKELEGISGDEYQAWMPGVAVSYAFPLIFSSIICLLMFFSCFFFKFKDPIYE